MNASGADKGFAVACSGLSNRIYAGLLKKRGDEWRDGKTDVTGAACAAVAQHVLAAGGEVIVSENGEPRYELRAVLLVAGGRVLLDDEPSSSSSGEPR